MRRTPPPSAISLDPPSQAHKLPAPPRLPRLHHQRPLAGWAACLTSKLLNGMGAWCCQPPTCGLLPPWLRHHRPNWAQPLDRRISRGGERKPVEVFFELSAHTAATQ